MTLKLFKKSILFAATLIFSFQSLYAQSEYDKWVFGVGMNAVDFFPFDTEGNGNSDGFFNEITNAMDHWNIGGPKIHATRHIFSNFSVEGAFSYNVLTKFGETETERTGYIAIDLNAQYALFNVDNDFNIALSVGGGYVDAYNSGASFNVGGNLNWWFSDSVGFNFQGLVKYNSPDFSLEPHMYYGFSVVYRPSNGRLGSSRRYMWRNGF